MMTSKRIALLTGASVATLGLAMPAEAVTVPGIGAFLIAPNVINTLTISSIGDDFDFGVYNDGAFAAPVTATVNTVATGEIEYIATANGVPPADGHVDMTLVNNGSVTVAAEAIGGDPTASALVQTGVFEQANAPGDAVMDLTNAGTLDVHALATVSAFGGGSVANATVVNGIVQDANAGSAAAITLGNLAGATLNVSAVADVIGFGATANASVGLGISQNATGATSASVALANAGTITILADADASGTTANANANATISTGINQSAIATTSASASLTNGGILEINAVADRERRHHRNATPASARESINSPARPTPLRR